MVTSIYLDIRAHITQQVRMGTRDEVEKLTREYTEMLGTVSADEFQQQLLKFETHINRITRSAGLGGLWKMPET